MSLRYGRLFDATVRDAYQRALAQAKVRLGPVLPGERTQLPVAAVIGGSWRDAPLIKARLAGGYCLRAAAHWEGYCYIFGPGHGIPGNHDATVLV